MPAGSMAGRAHADPQTEALLVQTRLRAGRMNRYVNMIPARFYLSSEALQAHKPRNGLDPAQYKPTSQLLAEVTSAAASAASAGSSSQAASKKKKAKKQGAADGIEDKPESRGDLRKLLERRIAELKEERRKKQSAADLEKNEAAPAKKEGEKRVRAEAEAPTPVKKQRLDSPTPAPEKKRSNVTEDDVEAGRLTFEPRASDLPFESGINRRGHKVNQLRASLRKEEGRARKLNSAEENGGDRDALRNQFALDTALRRARGEKVHNDVPRMRKVQKQLERTKTKGKEKWDKRNEMATQVAADAQAKRKGNLQARVDKKKAKKDGRMGFEGKAGFVNGES